MTPIAVVATGMVTGVGLTAPASVAAIRAGISAFAETRFIDNGGEMIIAARAPTVRPWTGRERLLQLAAEATQECLQNAGVTGAAPPIMLCVSEEYRPGRFGGMDDSFLDDLAPLLKSRRQTASKVIADGRVSGARAILQAVRLLEQGSHESILIVGVDSYLTSPTLRSFESRHRLKTSKNSNGFIPGEAAAAILVRRANKGPQPVILGIGFGLEPARIDNDVPCRADGLTTAIRQALSDSGRTFADIDYRMTDANGEQFAFRDAALAEARSLRIRKETFEHYHLADCIGEVGAAVGPCAVGVVAQNLRQGHAPGKGALIHFHADQGDRAAILMRYE